MAVLMLQAFAVQGRTPGGAAEQKATAQHVAAGPDHVAHALEAEHRIEHVERNGWHAVHRVGGAGGEKGRDRAGFADAFLQDLTIDGFAIGQQRIGVHRPIVLTGRRIDAGDAKQGLHAESPRFVRHYRHHVFPDLLVAHEQRKQTHGDHGGRHRTLARAGKKLGETFERGHRQRPAAHLACWHIATELHTLLLQIAHLRAVCRRAIKLGAHDFFVTERNAVLARAGDALCGFQVFLLMHGIAALDRAQTIAFDGLHQDYGRLAGRTLRALIGGVDLARILPPALDVAQLVVGQRVHHARQHRVVIHPVLALDVARRDRIPLIVTVDRVFHALAQHALAVLREQPVPAAAPNDFDHIPVGAAKAAFEFLNDLAVAAHRAVETLQIAVHHQHQIVEVLARSEIDGAEHFRLIRFTVADEAPHASAVARFQSPILQILGETRLINGGRRRQAHGSAGHLPEIAHRTRMRIGRQSALGRELATEVGELRGADATLDEGPRIDAGRGVRLRHDQVTAIVGAACAEAVVEADFEQSRRRGIGSDMAADAAAAVGSAQHHRHRVPAHQQFDAFLERDITGIGRLLGDRNGVDIGRVERGFVERHALLQRLILQRAQNGKHAGRAIGTVDVIEGFAPFAEVGLEPIDKGLRVGHERCTRDDERGSSF